MSKHPLGLPKGSVRAMTMLFMSIGFVTLHLAMLWAILVNKTTDVTLFLGVVGSYSGVYGVIVAFYFRKDDNIIEPQDNSTKQ